MTTANNLTVEFLREILHYEPETGVLTWRVQPNGRVPKGSVAGYTHEGYIALKIKRKRYFAHNLAWFYVYDEWPNCQLDHIDLNPKNNRIANLRLCTVAQNLQNRSIQSNNTSGHPGVKWHKNMQKWTANIGVNGRRIWCGSFDLIEEAIEARKAAKLKHHPFHPIDNTVAGGGASSSMQRVVSKIVVRLCHVGNEVPEPEVRYMPPRRADRR